jgi:2-keto-4-pentenoate hydratase/2-oxohepta-3-ene-1,7-dioic acid hydratase in catechol pathway
MIFVTFEQKTEARLGALSGERVVDLGAAYAEFKPRLKSIEVFPRDMIGLIQAGDAALAAAERLASLGADAFSQPLAKVRLLAPIPMPRKNVFCVGRNYQDHVAEGDKARGKPVEVPQHAQFFSKPCTAVIGPGADIPLHRGVTEKLDYEVELAMVIGKTGKNIPRERAFEHVFGFTIINDVTGRDLQRLHGQWFKGKALDGSCPMGPYLVHKSHFKLPPDLAISLKVNGELRQSSRTSNMIFDLPYIVSVLSQGMTLEAGDVIATGTPSGVGFAMDPPRFLKDGDLIEAEIEGIGVLRNTIRDF